MSPIERQLTMVIDARRRDMARMFVALFVAMSMMFSAAAGAAGPVQVVFAAEAPDGDAGPEAAVEGGEPEGSGEVGDESVEDGDEPEEGSEEPVEETEASDDAADDGEPEDGAGEPTDDEGLMPAVQLMGGPGGGGSTGTVVIHKFGKGVAGNEFPLNGARFLLERWERGCFLIFCGYSWKEYKTVTDNGKDDHDKDAPGVIELRLPAGKYRISEDRAPDGYTKSSAKFEVDVKAGKSYGPFKFVNQLKITKPAIIIKKYADENNNGKIDKHDTLLGGVTFLVERLVRSGNKWVVNKSFHVTDNGPDDDDPTPGVILLNKVSLKGSSNQYRVTEIAPEGWVALTPPITKEITKKKSSSQVVFEFLNQRVPEPDPEPDLSVVKTLIDPESGVATKGDLVVFEITVENTGEVDLKGIQVTDTFDASYLEFVDIDEVDDEQVNGDQISWTIDSLGVGESRTFTVRFNALAPTGGKWTTNKVEARADDLVRQGKAKVKIVEPEPEPEPDLRVFKTLTDPISGVATVGDPVLFQITVENTGEVALEDIQVTDAFNAGYLEFVGVDEIDDEQVNGDEITWTIPSLAKGASVTYTAWFIAKAATSEEGTINQVTVRAGDLVRKAEDEVVIVAEPTGDLVIYKYGENDDELLPGAAFRITGDGFELEVEDNEDGKDADSSDGVIRIKGLRPGWYEVEEVQAPAGYRLNPEPEPVEIACPEPVGPTLTVYEAEDSPCGEAVVVFFNEREEDDTPRTPGRVPRTPRVDLAVSKVVDDPTPQEGQQVTFTITVTNGGPDDAEGVVYSDLIPAGLIYVSHSASQGNYDPVSGEWEVGDLADGASATLMVTVIVDAGTAGQILTNTVTLVSSSPADTNSSNNSASASVTPPQLVLIEEEPPAAGPGEDEAPPLPVTGGSAVAMVIPGLLSLAAGVYLRRRFL